MSKVRRLVESAQAQLAEDEWADAHKWAGQTDASMGLVLKAIKAKDKARAQTEIGTLLVRAGWIMTALGLDHRLRRAVLDAGKALKG